MTPLDKLETFVRDNYECCQSWKAGALRDWLLWAFDNGYLFFVVGRNGNPASMAVARPLDPADAVDGSYIEHTPASGNVYIDLTVADSKLAMKPLMAQIVNKFGVRDTISFHRYGKSKKPKIYDFRKFSLRMLTS